MVSLEDDCWTHTHTLSSSPSPLSPHTPPTGETLVCTEDPKRSIGLWHGVMAAAYNGLHVVYVPPSVMATLPTAWLHMIQKHKGRRIQPVLTLIPFLQFVSMQK